MNIKTKKMFFTITRVFAIIEAIIMCISIIFIPFAIFMFIASNKLKAMEEKSDTDFSIDLENRVAFGWSIFLAIVGFPYLVFAVIAYFVDTNESIIVETKSSAYVDELDALFDKKEKGIITEEEYKKLKAEILNRNKN